MMETAEDFRCALEDMPLEAMAALCEEEVPAHFRPLWPLDRLGWLNGGQRTRVNKECMIPNQLQWLRDEMKLPRLMSFFVANELNKLVMAAQQKQIEEKQLQKAMSDAAKREEQEVTKGNSTSRKVAVKSDLKHQDAVSDSECVMGAERAVTAKVDADTNRIEAVDVPKTRGSEAAKKKRKSVTKSEVLKSPTKKVTKVKAKCEVAKKGAIKNTPESPALKSQSGAMNRKRHVRFSGPKSKHQRKP